jgi:hypothetical protein
LDPAYSQLSRSPTSLPHCGLARNHCQAAPSKSSRSRANWTPRFVNRSDVRHAPLRSMQLTFFRWQDAVSNSATTGQTNTRPRRALSPTSLHTTQPGQIRHIHLCASGCVGSCLFDAGRSPLTNDRFQKCATASRTTVDVCENRNDRSALVQECMPSSIAVMYAKAISQSTIV